MGNNIRIRLLTDDDVGMMYEKCVEYLSSKGTKIIEHPEALKLLDRQGAQVDFDGGQVRFSKDVIEEALGISRYLDWTFVSCRTGARKPDPEAYLNVAQTLQVKPSDCIFIDDREVNIASAREVGMDAILRMSTGELRHELARRGVLVA